LDASLEKKKKKKKKEEEEKKRKEKKRKEKGTCWSSIRYLRACSVAAGRAVSSFSLHQKFISSSITSSFL